jgi:hypothetical protein
MWKKIKPKVSRLVLFSIQNHWLILVVTVVILFVSGEAMVEPKEWLELNRRSLFTVHAVSAKFLLVATGLLGLEKIYLYLLRKQKI